MTTKLTKQEAIAFQQYLVDRFGPAGEHFGLRDRYIDLEAVEEVVDLPEDSLGWLVPSWRIAQR